MKALNESKLAITEQDASVVALEKQVDELTEVLTQSTEKLQQATAALSAPPPARQAPPPMTAAEVSRLQSAVKEPTVTTETDLTGKESRKYVFPELIDPTGKTLASNMEYTQQYGSRVAFKSETGKPAIYEAEDLHPGILAHLGIDLYEAKRKQEELDDQRKKHKEIARLQQAARQKAQRLAAIEEAKRADARQKEKFERDAKLAQIANDRLRAEAAMRQADAAIMESQRPPDIYYGQTQYNPYNSFPLIPTTSAPQAPQSRAANQIPAPQGAPQRKPFVAPKGQLPARGQLKFP